MSSLGLCRNKENLLTLTRQPLIYLPSNKATSGVWNTAQVAGLTWAVLKLMKTTPIPHSAKESLGVVVVEGRWWNSRDFFFFWKCEWFWKARVLKCLLCGGLKFLHLSTKRPEKWKHVKRLSEKHDSAEVGWSRWGSFIWGNLCMSWGGEARSSAPLAHPSLRPRLQLQSAVSGASWEGIGHLTLGTFIPKLCRLMWSSR